MRFIPAKTPSFVKRLFPNYIWHINTVEKVLYLTFDDGPTPEITPWVLEQLKVYNAKATFFCIGDNIEKHSDIFQQVLDDGHSIGNHTYHHLNGWRTASNIYRENVALCHELLIAKTKDKLQSRQLFRPPYGKLKPHQSKQVKGLGYDIIMWDVLSFDWDTRVSKKQCLDYVINNVTQGSVVVFHDSLKAAPNLQYALLKVLQYYSEKGFRFKGL